MDGRKEKIGRSTGIVIFLTIAMKLAAFLKQTVLARYFGATVEMDLYLLSADTVGDFSNAVFSALSVSVLTLYAGYSAKGEMRRASRLISATLKLFVPLSILFGCLFFALSGVLSELLAMNYSLWEKAVVADYIKVVSPTIVFSCITYIFVALLDAKGIFGPGKMINFTLSMAIIFGTLFWNSHGVGILIWAYMLAYLLHMIYVCFCSRRYWNLRERIRNREVLAVEKPVLVMFFPMLIGNAAVEINGLIDKMLATGIGKGGVAAQTFGGTLNSFVVTIFISAPSGVLVSYLSDYAAKKDFGAVENQISRNILISILLLLPVSLISICGADSIIGIVYQRGEFNQAASASTAGVLRGYAAGFCFAAVREIIIKVHLAYRDSKTVMINGLVTTGLNILFSVILSHYLGLTGLSLGTSIGIFSGMALAVITLKKHQRLGLWKGVRSEIGKMLLAAVPLFGVLKWNPGNGVSILPGWGFLLTTFAGMLAYAMALYLLRSRTFREFCIVSKNILWKHRRKNGDL